MLDETSIFSNGFESRKNWRIVFFDGVDGRMEVVKRTQEYFQFPEETLPEVEMLLEDDGKIRFYQRWQNIDQPIRRALLGEFVVQEHKSEYEGGIHYWLPPGNELFPGYAGLSIPGPMFLRQNYNGVFVPVDDSKSPRPLAIQMSVHSTDQLKLIGSINGKIIDWNFSFAFR